MEHTFFIPVLAYENGRLAVVDSDIKGLIIEVGSFHELLSELRWLAKRLLRSNHKLTDEEIAQAELIVQIKPFVDTASQEKQTSFSSLPKVLWGNEEHSYPLEYA